MELLGPRGFAFYHIFSRGVSLAVVTILPQKGAVFCAKPPFDRTLTPIVSKQFRRLNDGNFVRCRARHDVSVVACDIGNKLTFAEGGAPAAFLRPRENSSARPPRFWLKKVLTCKPRTGRRRVFGFPRLTRNTRKRQRALFPYDQEFSRRGEDKEKVIKQDIRRISLVRSLLALQEAGSSLTSGNRPGRLRPESFLRIQRLMETSTLIVGRVVARPIDFLAD